MSRATGIALYLTAKEIAELVDALRYIVEGVDPYPADEAEAFAREVDALLVKIEAQVAATKKPKRSPRGNRE